MKQFIVPIMLISIAIMGLLSVCLYELHKIAKSQQVIASPVNTTACDPMEYQLTLDDSGTYVYD